MTASECVDEASRLEDVALGIARRCTDRGARQYALDLHRAAKRLRIRAALLPGRDGCPALVAPGSARRLAAAL